MPSLTIQLLGLSVIATGGAPAARPVPQSLLGPRDGRASEPAFAAEVLANPCPVGNDAFGVSTALLEFDGDDRLDIAVGVPGRGAVYVFYGTGGGGDALYSHFSVHNADGARSCPPPFTRDDMGWDLAVGQLDGDAADELVVGAPRHESGGVEYAGAVYVFGLSAPDDPPLELSFAAALPQQLGASVAIGDFDGDGENDVAAGAPKVLVAGLQAGQVMIFPGPLGTPSVPVLIDNPAPVANGNFGHDLAVSYRDGDGADDLFVSAVGNTGSGIPLAGQVFYFPGPVRGTNVRTIEDPEPNPADLPSPRFGMSLDARGELLLVGAPRKDLASVMDTGVAYEFSGVNFQTWRRYRQPAPKMNDFTGFRVLLADFLGSGAVDSLLVALTDQALTPRNRRVLLLFDGALATGGRTELYAIERSGDHFGEGMSAGQLFPGGTEEILAGDPSYGEGPIAEQGRVVVYFRR